MLPRPLLRVVPLLLLSVVACRGDAEEDGEGAESDLTAATTFQETTTTTLRDQACGTGSERGCYTNYAVVADLDDDGKLDLVMANGGDHFFPSDPEPQSIFFGDGNGAFADGTSAFPGLAPSIVRQVAIADFDGDGRLDVYMPSGYGTTDDQLFMQASPRRFTAEANRIAGSKRSHAGGVHAGDIDNDGDIDIVVADWGNQPNDGASGVSAVTIRVLENDGRGHFTAKATLPAPGGSSATDIDLQDVNGDFSLDIVLTNRNGQSRLYFNDGRGTFTDVTESKAFPKKQGPFTFNAELCDIDGDGHLDLFFDGGASNLANHATQILMNDGTGRFTDETTARIPTEPRSDDNQVKCVDFDNDGHMDLVVASLTNATEKLFRNVDGRGNFEFVPNAFPSLRDPTLSLDFGDFDGDGRVDMMTAQGEVGGAPFLDRIFKNTSPNTDRNKPVFRALEKPHASAQKPTPIHVAVSDAHTSETGQHVKAVGFTVTVDGKATDLPATFVGGDLFRAIIPAQARGAKIQVAAHATDRAGNDARGLPIAITVE